jgi:pimeloyl-ACP methyl ester carboxylesterase
MRRFAIALLLMLACTAAQAQEIAGIWQGGEKSRHVLKIRKTANGLAGDLFNLPPESAGNPLNGNGISEIHRQGRHVIFTVDRTGLAFDGTLAENGKTLSGSLKAAGPAEALTLERVTPREQWPIDPSPHRTRFITVEKGVSLEVLDWGGNGPPLVFMAGLGNTAHVFDSFALHFTANHHVYAITRRGIGASSAPPPTGQNYDADRLGDDVLAVIAALKLDRPVLAGHSIAGEELSSIGSRHPEAVAGLIYLDAAFARAFYAPDADTLDVDVDVMRRDLARLPVAAGSPSESRALIDEVQSIMPRLQVELPRYREKLVGLPELPQRPPTPQQNAFDAIIAGERKYTIIKPPTLAIMAVPHACAPNCDSAGNKAMAAADIAQADGFEKGNPKARVVRLPYANHYVFRSNEADVVREMNAFMDTLAKD